MSMWELKPIRTMRCRHCSSVVFGADCGGLDSFADPVPLQGVGVAYAVIAGRRLYRLHRGRLKPFHPSTGPAEAGSLLADHWCRGRALRKDEAEEVQPPPDPTQRRVQPSAPLSASRTTVHGGSPSSPDSSASRSAATSAIRRPSERPVCAECERFFEPSEDRWTMAIPGKGTQTRHFGPCPPRSAPNPASKVSEPEQQDQKPSERRTAVFGPTCSCHSPKLKPLCRVHAVKHHGAK